MNQPKDYPEIDLMSAAEKLAGAISGKTRTICRTIERCVLYVCISSIVFVLLTSDARAHIEAEVLRVVDGDTVHVRISPVPGSYYNLRIRIRGVNAPERTSKRDCETKVARRATEFVKRLLDEAGRVDLEDIADGTWAGRHVADIYVDGVSLADLLVSHGLAVRWDGKGKRPRWSCEDW